MSPRLLTILSSNPSINTFLQILHMFLSAKFKNITGEISAAKKIIYLQKNSRQTLHPHPQKSIRITLQANVKIYPLEIMLSTTRLMAL